MAPLAIAALLVPLGGCDMHGHITHTQTCTTTQTTKKCKSKTEVTVSTHTDAVHMGMPLVASGYHMIFTTQNAVMQDGSYTGTIGIYDSNNNLIAQTSAGYYVSGNTAYPANPTQAQTWIENHLQPGYTVKIGGDYPFVVTNPNASTAVITSTVYANSQSLASATSFVPIPGGGGSGCGVGCFPSPNSHDAG